MRRLATSATVAACLFFAACDRKPETVAATGPGPSQVEDPSHVVLPPNSPKLQQIHVDAVSTREVAMDEVIAPGKITANPNRVSRVMLPVTGRVVQVLAHLGDAVTQGQPVVILESSDADTALAADVQADAGLYQANAAFVKAKADYDRLSDLLTHEAVARKDVEAAEASLAQAKSGVDQAEATRRQTRARLELLGLKPGSTRQRVEVGAPIAGKVLEVSTVAGEFRNDTSNPVMTIADLSTVWVESDVPENQIRMVQRGEQLQTELTAYPGRLFRATVTRIGDSVDPNTRTIKVYAELANPGTELKPEMFGRVRQVSQVRRQVAVPAAAVVAGSGQNYVFREVSPGTFDRIPVTVGSTTDGYTAILSGLERGARIVVDGAMLLKAD